MRCRLDCHVHEVAADTSADTSSFIVAAGNLVDLNAGSGERVVVCRRCWHWCRLIHRHVDDDSLIEKVVGDDKYSGSVDLPWPRTCHGVVFAENPQAKQGWVPAGPPRIADGWPPAAGLVVLLSIEPRRRQTVIGSSKNHAWDDRVLRCQLPTQIGTHFRHLPVAGHPLSG